MLEIVSADKKLRIYFAAFVLATAAEFALFQTMGWATQIAAAAGFLGVGAGVWRPLRYGALLDAGVLLVLAVACAPLGGEFARGAGAFATLVYARLDWPIPAAMLFGYRLLAIGRAKASTRFFADPAAAAMAASPVSLPATIALGGFFALMFYLAVGALGEVDAGALGRMAISALRGSTAIHVAIVGLLFWLLAAVAEAWREALADLATVTRIARDAVAPSVAEARVSRGGRLVFEAIEARVSAPKSGVGRARAAYEAAARRFLRSAAPLLPLLGFLGTVVGIGAAVADLPTSLGASNPTAAIAGTLAGLAVKFETTLLGLAGSLVATVALALVEKREAEVGGAAERAADAVLERAPRHG